MNSLGMGRASAWGRDEGVHTTERGYGGEGGRGRGARTCVFVCWKERKALVITRGGRRVGGSPHVTDVSSRKGDGDGTRMGLWHDEEEGGGAGGAGGGAGEVRMAQPGSNPNDERLGRDMEGAWSLASAATLDPSGHSWCASCSPSLASASSNTLPRVSHTVSRSHWRWHSSYECSETTQDVE